MITLPLISLIITSEERLFALDLPVRIETKYIKKSSPSINVYYPIVTNLPHPAVEKR